MLPCNEKIAGEATVGDWLNARQTIYDSSLTALHGEVFDRFFVGRLQSRYFKPIDDISHPNTKKGEGFSIVTLYCAIIEFLASSRLGKNYAYSAPRQEFEYGRSKELFTSFLLENEPFSKIFSHKELAEDFYKNVRCGLVHEACTKNGWKILYGSNAGVAICCESRTVYRNALRQLFVDYIEIYKAQFLDSEPLRHNLIRKFDYFCDMQYESIAFLGQS